jgi:large subunit ribosomal protein L15
MSGQGARSGGGPRLGFEGGQTPLAMRSPVRRGFTNARFRVEYQVVNVGQLGVFPADAVVGPAELRARRLIDTGLYKVLGDGELEHALTVRAPKFSGKAKSKIQEAGGSIEEIAG